MDKTPYDPRNKGPCWKPLDILDPRPGPLSLDRGLAYFEVEARSLPGFSWPRFQRMLSNSKPKGFMYQYCLYLGLEGVPMSLLWGLYVSIIKVWTLWEISQSRFCIYRYLRSRSRSHSHAFTLRDRRGRRMTPRPASD